MEISHPYSKTKKCVISYSIITILSEHLEPWLLASEPLTVKSLKIYICQTGIKSVNFFFNQPSCLSISWWSLLFSMKHRRFLKYRVATLHHFELYQSFHFRKHIFFIWFLNKGHLLSISLKYANFATIVFINCIRLTLILLRQLYLQTKRYQFLKKNLG